MSYRLINANALAMDYKEVNDMPCIYADLPNGLDDGYYDLTRGNADKSRWFKLFGTPERAARTLKDIKCGDESCEECPIVEPCIEYGVVFDDGKALQEQLLEWLKGDAK